MSTLYLFALVGVAFAIVATLVAAILDLARKPHWRAPHFRLGQPARPPVAPVETSERRREQLPYVGVDRREAAEVAAEEQRRAA